MANSVIEAIQEGIWNFEPKEPERHDFESTHALPGTQEKVEVLAMRLRSGQPLWHPNDRLSLPVADPEATAADTNAADADATFVGS